MPGHGFAAVLLGSALAFAGCTTPGPKPAAPVSPVDLPGWHADSLAGLREAIDAQCRLRRPPEGWTLPCTEFRTLGDRADGVPPDSLRRWVEHRFRAWPVGAEAGEEGLLTGYYEPVVRGSLARERPDQTPLHAVPADLRPGVPYLSRAQIARDGLADTAVLAWIDDPIDAFFLHVQGSGRIMLRDGRTLRVGFAAHNGLAYRAIGRVLVERGELTRADADMGGIRRWLAAHPDAVPGLLAENPRYVFFRVLGLGDDERGPPGSLGVPLTPMRSLATDPRHIPPGSLVYVEAIDEPLRLLGVSQDTGGAIVGAPRADLFTGRGAEATRLAGRLRARARFWLLRPR